jgi:hypothetical protein
VWSDFFSGIRSDRFVCADTLDMLVQGKSTSPWMGGRHVWRRGEDVPASRANMLAAAAKGKTGWMNDRSDKRLKP